MKKIFSTLIAALFCTLALAQNSVVKGVIIDSETNDPEPFAVVQFINIDDEKTVMAFTMTEEDGSFSQQLPTEGCYILLFNGVGRKEIRYKFCFEGKPEYDFGDILIEFDAETLNSASVVAQANLVKMDVDKMTYKVSDDVDSKTSTVLDMLRKVPMVSVDGSDNITVNGSSNFQVFVDGKPNQMLSSNPSAVFKVMPASSVKSIEVVTNPGVKYDAEGVGGVLNITTNMEATGGASAADGQYGTVRLQGSNRGFGGGIFYNVQKGKWSFGVNANASMNNSPGTVTDETRIQKLASGQNVTTNHTEGLMKTPMIMGNLNAAYNIDNENTISLTAGLMHFGMNNDGTTSMKLLTADGLNYGYNGSTNMVNNRNNITASLDYQHNWKDVPARTLVFSYQFSAMPSVSNSTTLYGGAQIPGYDLTDRKTEGGSDSVNHVAQLDFSTPLGQYSTLNTGAKYQFRHSSSDQTNFLWNGSSFVPTSVGSLDYHFRNSIVAGYLEYEGNFGAIGVKGGIRYEHTFQTVNYLSGNGQDFCLDYGNLVPSLSFQWNIAQNQNLGLSYNMRISRPGITYLNPYVDITNPTSISYGNTDLQAEKTNNVSLVYNLFTAKLMVNATLRHSFSHNGISSYSFYDTDNVLNTTYGNIVKTCSTGLNLYAMYTPWPKTRIIVNGGTAYTNINSDFLQQGNAGWSYNVMVGLQQTLPWDLRLSANIISAGSSVTLQGSSSGISLAMVGLTKSFLDDKLSISINGVGSLKGITNMEMSTHSEGPGFVSDMVSRIPMGQISISLSYSFGKQSMGGGMKKKSGRHADDDEILDTQSISQSMGSMMSSF